MYIPSYDFRIFDLPMFSPLQAQEFGADTMFSANTPTNYVDFSINQLSGLTNPNSPFPYVQNQFPAVIDRFNLDDYFATVQDSPQAAKDRLRKLRDQANEILGENTPAPSPFPNTAKQSDCPPGYERVNPLGITWLSYCGKQLHSDDTNATGNKTAPPGMQALETGLNALPQGAGLFLIAIVAIVFLLLFVRK